MKKLFQIALAAAFVFAAGLAQSATVTVHQGNTTTTCVYAGIEVDDAGNVDAVCAQPGSPPVVTRPPVIPPVVTPPVVTPPPVATVCPVFPGNPTSIVNAYASGTTLQLASGKTVSFILPTPMHGKTVGRFMMSAGTSTWPVAPYHVEVQISKCKGLIQPSANDTCYGKFTTKTGVWGKYWYTKPIAGVVTLDTVDKIRAQGHCYAPPSEGPWYVNVKYTYAACESPHGGFCGWNYQWKNGLY